jgi:ATP-dependent protease ClpP protease subunit/inorganic pyrophosphatase
MKETFKLRRAEKLTNENPTQEQIEKGTYQKGVARLKDFTIVIENPKGSIRSGEDEKGIPWSNTMTYSYGYFKDTIGKDGDEVDVFLGIDVDKEFDVYVIDQVKERTKDFDEHKVMFGFNSEGEAVKAYLENYHDGWTGFQNIRSFSLSEFRSWLNDKMQTIIPAKKQKVSPMNYANVSDESEKINIAKIQGEVVADETLVDLVKQAGTMSRGETLVLEIASPGGSVAEGLEIMLWLERLSLQGIKIITVVTANAYSIASLIMLAADIKLISKHGQVMVHNPMVPELSYVNANELEKHISSLRELEGYMYKLYQDFTGLDGASIKLLMDNETYLQPHEAIEKGFADMIVNIKKTPYEMGSKPNKEVNMKSTINSLKQIIAKVNKDKFVNQLYYDQEGGDVEIYQADPSQFQIGDRVSKEDGEVLLADGSKLIIKGGVIEDITTGEIVQPEGAEGELVTEPAIEIVDENASTEPVVLPDAVEEITGEPVAPAAAEPVVEPAVEPQAAVEPVVVPATAEFKVAPQAAVEPVVEPAQAVAEPVVKPAEAVAEPVVKPAEAVVAGDFNTGPAPGAPTTKPVDQVKMVSIPAEAFAEMQANIQAMMAKLDSQEKEAKAKVEKDEDFKSTAVEAIETLAANTVSGFTPAARATVNIEPEVTGSIFQKLRKKAALAKQ